MPSTVGIEAVLHLQHNPFESGPYAWSFSRGIQHIIRGQVGEMSFWRSAGIASPLLADHG